MLNHQQIIEALAESFSGLTLKQLVRLKFHVNNGTKFLCGTEKSSYYYVFSGRG